MSEIAEQTVRRQYLNSENIRVMVSQALVSGSSFATSLIVGNACGDEGLGKYALAYSLVVFAIGFHSALVSIPFTVFFNSTHRQERPARLGVSLVSHFLLAGLVASIFIIAAIVFWAVESSTEASIAVFIAIASPLAMTREFVRRICFTRFEINLTVFLDVVIAATQLSLLFLLWHQGVLTEGLALLAVGTACLVGTTIFFVRHLGSYEIQSDKLRKEIQSDFVFGRWLLIEHAFTILSTYLMPWLLALYLDDGAVGIFAACFSIAGLSNPFLQGMGNYLLPVFSKLVAAKENRELDEQVVRYTWLTLLPMFAFLLVCLFAGEFLLANLFRRPEFLGYGMVIGVLAFRSVVGALGLTAHYFLLAIEKPKYSLFASVSAVVVMSFAAAFLIPQYQLMGAAVAWLLGTIVESIFMITGYRLNRLD